MKKFEPVKRNGKHTEPLSVKERKIRHRSRTEKRQALPRVRNGKPLNDLDDERQWLDW